MPHVRSVSIGVWLARGSRHESLEQSGGFVTTIVRGDVGAVAEPAWLEYEAAA